MEDEDTPAAATEVFFKLAGLNKVLTFFTLYCEV
jgi:hypothetical protein